MNSLLENDFALSEPPKRIVSLVPSLSELIIELVGAKKLVGRTKFCVHPKGVIQSIPKIGGTKNPRVKDIIVLKPDLIIANKEENRLEDIQELRNHCPVYVSDVKTLNDNYEMIFELGELLGESKAAAEIIAKTKNIFDSISNVLDGKAKLSACYLIWKKPYMIAGSDTFIHAIMEALGIRNVFEQDIRYPSKTIDEIKESNSDLILLSSEPYPFNYKDVEELKRELIKEKIILVNGEAFSWYGSRLLNLSEYLLEFAKKFKRDERTVHK